MRRAFLEAWPRARYEQPRVEDIDIQWARVAPGKIVVASSTRTFLHEQALHGGGPFSGRPRDEASLHVTKRLLDGAVGAAQRVEVPPSPPAPLTPLRWAWRLAGYYHTTHATPPLMTEAGRRFTAESRASLAAWAERKSRDERGHDDLALRDLSALGYDARAFVAACVPETAAALVVFFASLVRGSGDAARSAGYAYALERLAATRSLGEVRAVKALLPPDVDATRCLRVHSATGSDADHVEDIVELAAHLSHHERELIAAAAYETTLIGRLPRGPSRSEEDLADLFAPHRVANRA
jgi:hypothetical protein